MKAALPDNVVPHRKTPEFTETTIPQALLKAHNTKEKVWGKIVILEGVLLYYIGDEPVQRLTPERYGVVEPAVWHHVAPEPGTPVRFYVEFHQ